MADLQLLNGLSILVSGYSQLRCGLATYHWQKLLYLAWFAGVTHMSCLTFLRSQLYHHKIGRLWRAVCLGALAIMLLVGFVPTGHYVYGTSCQENPPIRPSPSDYAICYLDHYDLGLYLDEGDGDLCHRLRKKDLRASRQYMVISVLLLSLGTVFRLLRLFKPPSNILSRLQTRSGRQFIRALSVLHAWTKRESLSSRLANHFFYRPLLAFYLTWRTLTDFWTSMMFEVSAPRCS